MKDNKDKYREHLSASWALIVALKTAQSANFILHNEHLQGRAKQRVKQLYNFINNWMDSTSAINRKTFSEYDDLIEDNASAALETFMLVASIHNSKIDEWMEGVNKLAKSLKVENNEQK